MITLHPLLGDHAVLQCEKPLRLTGQASPLAKVVGHFAGLTATTVAAADGQWTLQLPALPPGGPHELRIESEGETVRRSDLLLGEVWFCSGQSNMEWTLCMVAGLEADIAAANDPGLRCFNILRRPADQPTMEAAGSWQLATPRAAREFSATAYFFARRLREATGRAVGIIVSAYGGTVIASWLPKAALTHRPEYRVLLADGTQPTEAAFVPHAFEPRTPVAAGWESSALDDAEWETMSVPGYWQDRGWRHNGAVWYRHTIALPPEWRGQELAVEFGACDDFDETFVNGIRVGGVGPEAPNAYAMRRIYTVPLALSASERLTIAVRVFDNWGNGGIVGDALLRLVGAPTRTLSLTGIWKAKVEKALQLRASTSGVPPSVLYNGMVRPFIGNSLRGFLWYQGESDVAQAALYRMLLPDLIATWRKEWNDPLLPFGIVQLANYQTPSPQPQESDWAELRDAQLLSARTVPLTGLAVTIDVGEVDNIHPRLKRPVGERLARWALAAVYGQPNLPWSSPLPADHWREKDALLVRFMHAGDGLRSRGRAPLQGFQIAGADRRWCWATATVQQPDIVRVRADGVADPVAVRYAWQINPPCTLANSADLPASPFRTDDWPLTTAHD